MWGWRQDTEEFAESTAGRLGCTLLHPKDLCSLRVLETRETLLSPRGVVTPGDPQCLAALETS